MKDFIRYGTAPGTGFCRIPAWLFACVLLFSMLPARGGDIFSFAGHTFDQRFSPTAAALLGNGAELGGATFSDFLPNGVTGTINFPQGDPGFDTSKSLAQLTGLGSGLRAVNLPRGNNSGTATNRHGIQVSWSNGTVLTNLPGKDFVVFESGSTSAGVEGIMVRVRTNAAPEAWTEWHYYPPDSFQITANPEVAFAFAYELTDLGVSENSAIDRIQIANLTEHDRIETATPADLGGGILVGQGRVLFDTNASNVLPDAGILDADRLYSSGTYDPDPFYIAVLHGVCDSGTPQLSIELAGNDLLLSWPAPSCYTLESCVSLGGTPNWLVATESLVITNGRNEVLIPNAAASRFFRLIK